MRSTAFRHSFILLAIRVIMITAAIGLVFVLIAWDVVLSGEFEIRRAFNKPDAFISELVPLNRVRQGTQSVSIIEEPVYTTLRYPRPFQTLDMTLEFRNPQNLFIEAGPQVDTVESYALQAVDHPQLDKIFQQQDIWTASERAGENGQALRLYQRRSDYIYRTMDQFFSSLPNQQNVGYYGTDWKVLYKPALPARPARSVIQVPLRGSHEFWLAFPKGEQDIRVAVQDINHAEGADTLTMTLYDSIGNQIAQEFLGDDGDATQNGPTSVTAVATIDQQMEEGVYRLTINTTDDVFLQRIETSAPYIVAKQRVRIAGGPEYEAEFGSSPKQYISLLTSAREWTAMTPQRSTAQKIHVGTEALSLDEPLKAYTYNLGKSRQFALNKGYDIQLEGGNVVLAGRGVFAFSQSQYFSPFPWYVDQNVDIDALQLQYILTNYQPPAQEEGGVMRQTLPIDLTKAFAPNRSLRVQFAVPELQTGEQVEMISAQLNYHAEPVTWSNAFEKFKRFFSREILKR